MKDTEQTEYVYFYREELKKNIVYISPEDGGCLLCPPSPSRNSFLLFVAAVLVIFLAGTLDRLAEPFFDTHGWLPPVLVLLGLALGAGIFFHARRSQQKTLREKGTPSAREEISLAHIETGISQLRTDRMIVLAMVCGSVLCALFFLLTKKVLLWLCFASFLALAAGLGGTMHLKERRRLYQWLSVYQSHAGWSCMLRFSGGYLVLERAGELFPDNNILAADEHGSVLWDIGSLDGCDAIEGYRSLEHIADDDFRVVSCSGAKYILHAGRKVLEKTN